MSSQSKLPRVLCAALAAALLLCGCGLDREPEITVIYAGPDQQTAAPVRSAPASEGETFVLNSSSVLFHRPGCSWAEKISPEHRIEWTGDRETLIGVGYRPCKICKP